MTTPHLALVPPMDTLTFSLTEEQLVVNDTMRFDARCCGRRTAQPTHAAA